MGLRRAILFACIAVACCRKFHWTTRLATRNPENNPNLNSAELGYLQSAWKSLEQASNGTYVLMLRSKYIGEEHYFKCVYLRAHIIDAGNKTANYTRTYYNTVYKNYTNETFQVRALNQTGYLYENVIREGLNGKTPSDTPIPQGSNTYIEYNNYSCEASYSPLWDIGNAAEQGGSAEVSDKKNSIDYRDLYMVYSGLRCLITRDPLKKGGCDLWLEETELERVLEAVENDKDNETIADEKKKEDSNRQFLIKLNCTPEQIEEYLKDMREDYAEQYFVKAAFKQIPCTCRLAFLAACGEPKELIYNPVTCINSRAEGAAYSDQ
ncbi:unnamed protein product, partial [Ixodes hexagonus]